LEDKGPVHGCKVNVFTLYKLIICTALNENELQKFDKHNKFQINVGFLLLSVNPIEDKYFIAGISLQWIGQVD
jgi:hypothetical protein